MDIVVLGIDLGKNSCSLAGLDTSGRVVLRRRMRRSSVESFVNGLGRCIVAMEACCGAHHLGRVFAAQGHETRLISPEYVRPYVKAQKNDELDAEAIAEAATRPTMRFVAVKSQSQSDTQALHRARERLVSERTALINHLRALLLERGIVAPRGRRKLQEELLVFADEDGIEALSPRIRLLIEDLLIEDLRSEWRALDERIAAFDGEFVRMARKDEAMRRLTTIPGIGTINATALAAAVGKARAFGRGRRGSD
jgi:transposase